jgi:hypothetical protein
MFCPQCGAPNEEDAVFCGNCGAVLNPDEETIAAEPAAPEQLAVVDEPAVEAEELFLDDLSGEPPAPPPPPPPPSPPRAYVAKAQTSGLAIASLVMGIAGWTLLPWIGSILAIIFGYMARNEIRQRPGELEGEGLAVAGLVLGWIMIGVSVLALCLGGLALCFLTPLFSSAVSY